MAATVKTLIEHSGELYWGTRQAMPGYHFGLSLNVMENGLVARAVYVMSDLDDSEEPLVTPELLASACFSVDDLVPPGIVPSDLRDDAAADAVGLMGWYGVVVSFFGKDDVEALRASNDQLDGYLDIVLAIMTISADEIAAGMPSLEEVSFFDLLDELEGIAVLIDEGALAQPLPFTFRLIGDALLGWESADEEDWR